NSAAFGSTISQYHLEAAIAYEHCMAVDYRHTNWKQILEYYNWLYEIAPSPITALNRAVVIMQVQGAAAALAVLQEAAGISRLGSFYLYNSLLGELHARLHHIPQAKQYFALAMAQTQSETE